MSRHHRIAILKHNALQLLIALDQLANALLGFVLALLRLLYLWPWAIHRWWADETISAHSWRWHLAGRNWPRVIIDAIFFWEHEHCLTCYKNEAQRGHSPPEQRQQKEVDNAQAQTQT